MDKFILTAIKHMKSLKILLLTRRLHIITKRPSNKLFSFHENSGKLIYLIAGTIITSVLSLSAPLLAQTPIEEIPGTTPIALVEEAYLAHRKGNYDAAIKGYTQIIQRRGLTKKERAVAYLLRGEAKRDAKKLNEAVLDFTRALKQWPGYPQAHYFRGQVYEMQNSYVEAYADLARALELDPTREAYQTSLAILKKRIKEAGIPIQSATGREPVSPPLPPDDNKW